MKTIAITDPIACAQALIKCASVTPKDEGALDLVEAWLSSMGFRTHRVSFEEVDNLYARLGEGNPHFSFAGHTDVVPPGDLSAWPHPPFDAVIEDGKLHGRGASDMKGAIAAFVAALARYLPAHALKDKGSISLLITGDEEAESINGTRKLLLWIKEKGETLEDCLVGEPSNPQEFGEAVKVGRRGSVNATLVVSGIQGHAANPHMAANPLPVLIRILDSLKSEPLDAGTEYFAPSNLEITSVDTGNDARNVIPAHARAYFNIRYNNSQNFEKLERFIKEHVDKHVENSICRAKLELDHSGECFMGVDGPLTTILENAIHQETGRKPARSTAGGTSDARFIKDYARTIEFGLTKETIHKVGEYATLEDIEKLTRIYERVLKDYFSR